MYKKKQAALLLKSCATTRETGLFDFRVSFAQLWFKRRRILVFFLPRMIGGQIKWLDMDNFSLEESVEGSVDLDLLASLCTRLEQLHLTMLHCHFHSPSTTGIAHSLSPGQPLPQAGAAPPHYAPLSLQFFVCLFLRWAGPRPHIPFPPNLIFVCKFSRHGSSSPVTSHLAPSIGISWLRWCI